MANKLTLRLLWLPLACLSAMALVGCVPMTETPPRLEEGVVRLFDLTIEDGGSTGKVVEVVDHALASPTLVMRVVPFTPDAELVIDAARRRRCRVLGYVRSDSEGVPRLGIPLPDDVILDLPAGPTYQQYQELVVIAERRETPASETLHPPEKP
jgi:hypothetical protein